ncbi:MAG: DUF3990 domain-containing protein [Bacteroidales bacterium]|nr:DUF3990 domain-containing protein [Bacteroidales bacterium]
MKVYHGSITIVTSPLVKSGRPNLDFGQGFYVTDMQEQAEQWAFRLALRKGVPPIVCCYDLDLESAKEDLRYKHFGAYDLEWLEFVVSNRRGGDAWKAYDIIEGAVANDRVVDTVELYMSNFLSAEEAIQRLRYFSPNNQLCITSQEIVNQRLKYIDSYIPE